MKSQPKISLSILILILIFTSACGPVAFKSAPAATSAPALSRGPAAMPTAALSAPLPVSSGNSPESQDFSGPHPPDGWPPEPYPNPHQQTYDTFFQNYGVNPRIDTVDDPLSTFALDVDTAAYTIMRNYVQSGSLPPQDSVRVEEYVNYFDQGYDYPPEGQAFRIQVDGAPSPFADEGYQLMRVGIQGYAVPKVSRKDVSLTFVIDSSGSMDMDNRLELVKRALTLLVDQLGPDDRLGIVTYGTEASVVLPPTRADDRQRILWAIDSLHPGGVTNAEAGLLLGYRMAEQVYNPESVNRVILCSDGVANLGETDPGAIWNEVEEYAGRQITLTTVGFGMDNYNDVLMEQLADKGNGLYAFVDDIQEARRLFIENLTSTLQVIAMDARVQVEFDPANVERYRLIGYENRAVADQDFRNDQVDAGEVGAGHSVTALYEVKLTPEAAGRLATVHLRWIDPETQTPVEIAQDFSTRELAPSFHQTDPHFQWSVLVAEYAEVLRHSYWARDLSLRTVLAEAGRIGGQLDEDPAVSEFIDLLHRAARYDR